MTNRLYFGDNLEILRKKIKDESVDLNYLDGFFQSALTLGPSPGGRGKASPSPSGRRVGMRETGVSHLFKAQQVNSVVYEACFDFHRRLSAFIGG